MNRMLLDVVGKGFMVGATVNSCTKGLWIWNKPLKCKMQDGTEVSTRLGKLHLDHPYVIMNRSMETSIHEML